VDSSVLEQNPTRSESASPDGSTTPVRRFLSKLELHAGLAKFTGRQVRQMRATLHLGLLFAASTAPYSLVLAFAKEYTLALILAGGALAYVSPLWLIPRGYLLSAKTVPAIAVCALVYAFSSFLGAVSNIHLALFLVMGWCMGVIDLELERAALGGLLTLAAVTFGLVQSGLTLRIGSIQASETLRYWMQQTMPGAVFFVFVFVLAPFYRKSQADEDRLEQSLRLLEAEMQRREVAERGLRVASDKLFDANQAKANFIAMMGHELRTPLNGVLSVNELLKETPLEEEQLDMVQCIEESGQRLLVLVNDILDYVNVRSGAVQMAKVPFNLLDLCEESVKHFEPLAEERNLALDLVISPEVPSVVVCDPSRVRQTLKALLSNAIKHTVDGGVTVSVDVVASGTSEPTFRICVADSGPGVPEELRESIFEEFTQTRVGPSRATAGIGLGLAFCKTLMTALGGKLELECPSEGGSRFSLVLPMAVPEQPEERRPLDGIKFAVSGEYPVSVRSMESVLTRLGAELAQDGVDVLHIDLSPRELGPASEEVPAHSGRRSISQKTLTRAHVLKELQPLVGGLAPVSSRNPSRPRLLRVLIVEDNIVNQKVLSKLVTSLGALVKCVENGALAVEACKSESVDVVFMDVEMPVMNGLDATRAIRALPGGAKIPIVGVSANAAPEEQERGLAAGMNCYLPKPVRKDQITAVIASIAKNRPPSLRALSG
jgi:signal transduction histidine kinase/CheY-like chemotaxis protein